eukprot:1334684-Rhodomonas_salina.2
MALSRRGHGWEILEREAVNSEERVKSKCGLGGGLRLWRWRQPCSLTSTASQNTRSPPLSLSLSSFQPLPSSRPRPASLPLSAADLARGGAGARGVRARGGRGGGAATKRSRG